MKWRTPNLLLEILGALVIAIVVLGAVAAWRLAQGPVSIGFLTPHIARMLADSSDVRIEVDDTILTWSGWSRPVEVRAVGVSATGSDGRTIATMPELAIRFSFRALLRGELEPTRIDVYQPSVRLVRVEDGTFRIGIGGDTGSSADRFQELADEFLAPPRPNAPFRYLRRVRIVDGSLKVDDRAAGFTWGAPNASLRIVRGKEDIEFQYDFRADLEDQSPHVRGAGRYHMIAKTLTVETEVSGLWLSRLATRVAALRSFASADLPIDARARVAFDADGDLTSGRLEISGGPGRLDPSGLVKGPVEIRSLSASGSLKQSPERLELESLELDLDGTTVSAQAVMTLARPVFSVNAEVRVQNLPVSNIGAYWPEGVSPNALTWVSHNLAGGVVREANASMLVRIDTVDEGLHLDLLNGTLDVAGMAIHYFRPLPPVTGVTARGKFGPDSLSFDVQRGHLNGIDIDGGTVALRGLGGEDERLNVRVMLNGPLRDALEVLDHPRLGFAQALDIDPQQVSGSAATGLEIGLPLLDRLSFSQVALTASSDLSGVALPGFVLGQSLEHGNLSLHVDNAGMRIAGHAMVAGVPSDLSLKQYFQRSEGIVGEATLKATVQEDHRARLGIDLAPYARGPVEVDARMTESADGSQEVMAAFGLAPATLAIPALDWEKPAGNAAEGSLVVVIDPARQIRVGRFGLTAGALSVNGSGELSQGEKVTLRRIDIERFKLGETDLSGRVTGDGTGGLAVAIQGPALDARPLLELPDSIDSRLSQPVDVTANIDRVIAAPDRSFAGLRGNGRYDGSRWRTVQLSAGLGEGRAVQLDYREDESSGNLTVRSDDAGKLLKTLGVNDGFVGGWIELTGRRVGDGAAPWIGRLLMKDFRVVGVPTLAQLLTLASLRGIRDVLSGNGIRFSRMEIPYALQNQRLRINNARSVGSQLGITADGTVYLGADTIDLRGTLVPAYTINSLLGHIPIVGRLFTGSKGSGVFAVSYTVTESLENPKITVNPLSVLAPGFLRNLVDVVLEGGSDNTPPPQPSPQQ